MLFKNYKKNILFIIIIILTFAIFDTFTNTYIVLRENYETRMYKKAGNCGAQGYGFYKKILNKFNLEDKNIRALNFRDFPSPSGYFFNYKNDTLNNSLILIGADKNIIQKYLNENYKIIYAEKDCYFIKND